MWSKRLSESALAAKTHFPYVKLLSMLYSWKKIIRSINFMVEVLQSNWRPSRDYVFHELRYLFPDLSMSRFFFIQIGANNGVYRDPIYEYIKKYQWKEIPVEPIVKYFRELENNY